MNPMRCVALALASVTLFGCSGTQEAAVAPDAAVSGEAVASERLDTGSWTLVEASTGPLATLEHARQVTMAFDEGHVSGYGGCNRYMGSYTVTGERLVIGPVASTKRYCEGEGNQVEQALHALLAQPFVLSREAGALRLTAPDGTWLRLVPEGQEQGKESAQ